MNKVNRVILCIIDDLRAEHLYQFAEKGLLPNLSKLIKYGISSRNCITDFPSVTFPTQATILTGTYTGDFENELCHGIPLYNWMGRNFNPPLLRNYGSNRLDIYKLNKDLGENCQTILEMVEGNKSSFTQFINRGTDYFYPETKLKLIFYYLVLKYSRNLKRMIARANTMVIHELLESFKKPQHFFKDKEPPIASLLWFMSSDVLLHWYGYNSHLYRLNLLHIDKVLGMLLDGLKELGYLNDTAIAITSDHGNFQARRLGDVSCFMNKYELRPYHPRNNINGNMNIAEFGGVGFFYFKGDSKDLPSSIWRKPSLTTLQNFGSKKIDLTQKLFKLPGSTLMYYSDPSNTLEEGTIFLKRKDKRTKEVISGKILYKGKSKNLKSKYICESNEKDIFGYYKSEIAASTINGKYLSNEDWTAKTNKDDFPAYPDLIVRHFKNPRSADVILSTKGEVIYNIEHGKRKNKNMFGHDLGTRNCSIVPLIIAGSKDIPARQIPYCRTIDIVPTLLKLLGKKPHPSVIGESLV